MAHADTHHDAHAAAPTAQHAPGQQHPLGVYFKIWGLLFVLSIASYLVDYFHVQGYLRWTLIVTLMLLKAPLPATAEEGISRESTGTAPRS